MNHLISALMPAHAAIASTIASQPIQAQPIDGKYIIIAHDGRELPILFSRELQHSTVMPKSARALSAGFYQFIAPDQVLVTGASETLKLSSRPQDAELIKTQLLFL
jgi:hypothetical protein